MVDMRVIKVDVIGPEASETPVHGRVYRGVREVLARRGADLRGDEHPVTVTALAHPTPQ